MFFSNMIYRNEIKKIVVIERQTANVYIANQYKDGDFENSLTQLYENILARHSKAGHNYG